MRTFINRHQGLPHSQPAVFRDVVGCPDPQRDEVGTAEAATLQLTYANTCRGPFARRAGAACRPHAAPLPGEAALSHTVRNVSDQADPWGGCWQPSTRAPVSAARGLGATAPILQLEGERRAHRRPSEEELGPHRSAGAPTGRPEPPRVGGSPHGIGGSPSAAGLPRWGETWGVLTEVQFQ